MLVCYTPPQVSNLSCTIATPHVDVSNTPMPVPLVQVVHGLHAAHVAISIVSKFLGPLPEGHYHNHQYGVRILTSAECLVRLTVETKKSKSFFRELNEKKKEKKAEEKG